jgi:A/G-specific adenine glycosylase
MELGALVCTPRNAQCLLCPLKKNCVACKEGRVEELPNLGKRLEATARRFWAFVIERDGKFLVQQRPAGVVNAHLWEFPNVEVGFKSAEPAEVLVEMNLLPDIRLETLSLTALKTVKHSITRYRITLEAFQVNVGPGSVSGKSATWKTLPQLNKLAFSAAHKKILERLLG